MQAVAETTTRVIQPDQALEELTRRELAKRRLIAYAQYMAPWYRAMDHHLLIADALEEVAQYIRTEGKEGTGRLMIFQPPRTGKTELVSRIFPSWLLGVMPDSRIIVTSYGADLAQKNSSEIRNYFTSLEFKALFGEKSALEIPVELSEDSQAKSNWDLARPYRGGVVAAGVGGGITGQGAHLLVIDDPFKNRKDAESENYRDTVNSWYKSAAHNRLEKGGAIVITHTRWSPEDLAGELLKQMVSDPLADQWKIIFLPAIALEADQYPHSEAEIRELMLRGIYIPLEDMLGREPGEVLWPEKYDRNYLERERVTAGDYDFAAIYQQMPRPMDSGFFIESDFKVVERGEVPEGLKWVRYMDLALGESQTADWNTCLAGAMDTKTGDIYYRDMIREHELTKFLPMVKATMLLPSEVGVRWGVEKVNFQSLVLRDFLKDPELAAVSIEPILPIGDKEERARNVQVRARQGKVKLVRGEWNLGFIREALLFPKGKHDDQVDTASGDLQMIARRAGRRKATQHEG